MKYFTSRRSRNFEVTNRAAVVLTTLILLLFGTNVLAQSQSNDSFGSRGDPNWGFRFFQEPRFTGERTISVQIRNSRLDQRTRISSRPQQGKIRLELQYRRGNESWQSNHRIVPSISTTDQAGVFNVKAVLPQSRSVANVLDLALQSVPRQITTAYNTDPIKFRTADVVFYRWVIRDSSNQARRYPERRFTMPRPLSIAIIGDSFASGEGAPEKKKNSRFTPAITPRRGDYSQFAEWSNRDAHRSSKSGFVQGVRRFKNDNPDTWVEYIHAAISSASLYQSPGVVAGGMTGDFTGEREMFVPVPAVSLVYQYLRNDRQLELKRDIVIESQLSQVERWVANERIGFADIVMLSIGGNDAGFGEIINKAAGGSLSSEYPIVRDIVRANLDRTDNVIPGFFEDFETVVKPRHYLWANYPNLTRNHNGRHSSLTFHPQTLGLGARIYTLTNIAGGLGFFASLGNLAGAAAAASAALIVANESPSILLLSTLIDAEDLLNAEDLLVNEINPRIDTWCGQKRNCQVLDIENRSRRHGITATSDRWFNTFIDSHLKLCGGLDCAVHPNADGHRGIYMVPVAQGITGRYEDILSEERSALERSQSINLANIVVPSARDLSNIKQSRDRRNKAIVAKHPKIQTIGEAIRKGNPDSPLPKHKVELLMKYFEKVDPESIRTFNESNLKKIK